MALAVYAAFYTGIERQRVRKGPWRVAFTKDTSGAPAILINQPKLAITNLQITFPGETPPTANSVCALVFDQPRPVPYAVPFGKCIFMDTTFQPGTIVLNLFGHEIQLIPRVLTIDKEELPWRSNATIPLPGNNSSPRPSTPIDKRPAPHAMVLRADILLL